MKEEIDEVIIRGYLMKYIKNLDQRREAKDQHCETYNHPPLVERKIQTIYGGAPHRKR